MSRLSVNDPAVVAEVRAALIDDGFATGIVAETTALTSTEDAVAFTYTTDDPGITPDGEVTIADGDAVTIAEQHELATEVNDQLAKLRDDVAAYRTLVEALRTAGTAGQSVAALTAGGAADLTYTTDDPGITPNQAVTIADGDLYDAAEIHEALVEINAEVGEVYSDVVDLRAALLTVVTQGWENAPALQTRASNSGGVTITFTTDDPSITPNAAITIADGDLLPASEAHELVAELEDQLDKIGDDYAAVRVTYEALRALARG